MKYIATISLPLYNSLKINIETSIMQNRRLKLKQVRKEIFKQSKHFFIAKMEYTQSAFKTFLKNHLSMSPMAKWALATNPVDVQLRTVFEQTIKNKHIENKKSCILLAKHYPSGTITDIIEEHMSNNKTSLDESIQMIVDDILINESTQV